MRRKVVKILALVTALMLLLPTVGLAGHQEMKGRKKPKKVAHISLNKKSVTLTVGATQKLAARITPPDATSKSIKWGSTEPEIATVDQQGTVKGIKEGTAIVYAIALDGYKMATCTVKVVKGSVTTPENGWVKVTGVKLNLIQTTLPVGFKDTLRARIEPSNASDKEVKWSSSNSNVAQVNSRGEVTAVTTGTVVISAQSVDGAKVASCVVTVVPAVQPPNTGVLLNKLNSLILVGEKDYPAPLLYPSTTIITGLTWSSSNSSVATVNERGEVTGVGRGSAVITVRTSENYTASYTVTVI